MMRRVELDSPTDRTSESGRADSVACSCHWNRTVPSPSASAPIRRDRSPARALRRQGGADLERKGPAAIARGWHPRRRVRVKSIARRRSGGPENGDDEVRRRERAATNRNTSAHLEPPRRSLSRCPWSGRARTKTDGSFAWLWLGLRARSRGGRARDRPRRLCAKERERRMNGPFGRPRLVWWRPLRSRAASRIGCAGYTWPAVAADRGFWSAGSNVSL
jgi:hypothetical protein